MKRLEGQAEAVESAGDILERRRLVYFLPEKVSPVVRSSLGFFNAEGLQGRVMYIQTVDIVYGPIIFRQKGGQVEEPQGFSPEVIGGEIVDPWVDQEEIFPLSFQLTASIIKEIRVKAITAQGGWDDSLSLIMMIEMKMRMRVYYVFMPVAMYVYEVICLEQFVVFQYFPGTA